MNHERNPPMHLAAGRRSDGTAGRLVIGPSVPSWLSDLTPSAEGDLPTPLPLRALLDGSVFYAASRFDGTPVRLLGSRARSFVYVDYGVEEARLLEELKTSPFAGYELLGSRAVLREELAPDGWVPRPPRGAREPRWEFVRTPFARWLVFDRRADLDDAHGPARWSLLYVGGDGVATYQALYHGQSVAPLAVCVIQPGHGFGGNWTDFTNRGQAFAEVVMDQRPELRPRLLAYGGRSSSAADYRPACWPEFDVELGVTRQDRAGRSDDGDDRGRVVLYERST
jgi:hypothetical protein